MTCSPVAAIDCGTNSTRLLVVDAGGDQLIRLMRITRLGQGVDREKKLAPQALARTLDVLHEFRSTMDHFGVGRVRMVATSAVRDAENGSDFIELAAGAIGSVPEVLSGTEEGTLAYGGACADLASFEGDTLVVDIGGGSTEIILGRGASPLPLATVSLQLGCVRLTERCLRSDPPTPQEVAATRTVIMDALTQAQEEMSELNGLNPARRLVGLAGTVSTLASIKLGIVEYDMEKLHHAQIGLAEVQEMCAQLASLPARERSELPGMVPGRQDVILGGALVLELVMAWFQFPEVIVSEKDILDGIALSIS